MCETLLELKTKTANQERTNRVGLQNDDIIMQLRITNGHASCNILNLRQDILKGFSTFVIMMTSKSVEVIDMGPIRRPVGFGSESIPCLIAKEHQSLTSCLELLQLHQQRLKPKNNLHQEIHGRGDVILWQDWKHPYEKPSSIKSK